MNLQDKGKKRTTQRLIIVICTIVIALLVFSSNGKSFQKKKPQTSYGKYDFVLTTLEGKRVSLSDYVGKVVLVNIWAPWCGPCKKEVAGFANLYKQYRGKGFEILSVAVQTNESDVRSFIQTYSMQWPVGINDDVARNYGTYGLPDNYLFMPDGSIAKHFVGFTQESALKPWLDEAIKRVVPVKSKK